MCGDFTVQTSQAAVGSRIGRSLPAHAEKQPANENMFPEEQKECTDFTLSTKKNHLRFYYE